MLALYQQTNSRLLEPSHEEELRGRICIKGQIATGTITQKRQQPCRLRERSHEDEVRDDFEAKGESLTG
jgi:hypothetical protein